MKLRLLLLAALVLVPLAAPAAEETPLERLCALGLALERDFEFRRAEAVYEEALRRAGASVTSDILLALARVAEAVNDIPGARARYGEVARCSPGRPEPDAGEGWLAVKLDRRAEAKRHFLDSLGKDPRYAPACAGLAFVAIEAGDFDGADAWLDRAEATDPDVEVVLAARSEWLFRRGDMTGSTLLLRRLRRLNPSHLGAMQRLASGYTELGRQPYFPPRVPADYDLLVRRAAELYRALRFDGVETLLASLDRDPAPDGRPAFYRGLAALRAGDARRAVDLLRRAAGIEPSNARFLNALCVACRRLVERQCAEYGGGRDRIDRLGGIAESLPSPGPVDARGVIRDLEHLLPAERTAVLRAVAPAAARLPEMRQAGATHEFLDYDEDLTERPVRRSLLGRRTADGRAYADLRGVGGRNAATGLEMLADSAGLRYDTFAHEFAHQLHYYGLTTAEQSVVRRLYRSAREDGRCLDYYAATHESEYLAQGYEAFVGIVKSPWRHAIRRHTRAELAERDPPLYRFLCRITGTPDPDPALAPIAPRVLAFYEWAGDRPSLDAARSLLAPLLVAPAGAEPR